MAQTLKRFLANYTGTNTDEYTKQQERRLSECAKSDCYKRILKELIELRTSKISMAENAEDYSKITVGVYDIGQYITMIVEDAVEYVCEQAGLEQDLYREDLGLPLINGSIDR